MNKQQLRLSLAFGVICMLIPVSVLSQSYYDNEMKKDEYYRQGIEDADRGRNNLALANFQRVLIVDPEYTNAMTYCALSCKYLDFYASSIYYFQQVVEYSGEAYFGLGNLGSIYGEIGYDSLAMINLDKALTYRPDYAYSRNNRGCVLKNSGRFDEALSDLRIAINSMPEMADAYYNMAMTYNWMSQQDSALYYLDKTLEISPRYIKAYAGKLKVFKELGYPESELSGLCQKIIELSQVSASQKISCDNLTMRAYAYRLTGNSKGMKQDLESALARLDILVDQHPYAYEFRTQRAGVYEDLENDEAAISDYKRVLEINPLYPIAKKALARLQK